MIFRYLRALFTPEKKSVEYYWNSAGLVAGMLLLGSVFADKENFDAVISSYSSEKSNLPGQPRMKRLQDSEDDKKER